MSAKQLLIFFIKIDLYSKVAKSMLLFQNMALKGQMIYLQDPDAIIFLGSPCVERLDELMGKGIYISDIPIHDATRDVILVGEQTKAQVSVHICL